jgi:hypothetical protein
MRRFRPRGSQSAPPPRLDLGRITAFGQFQLDPGSVAPSAFGNLEADLYPLAIRDPEGFTLALAQLVLPAGDLATYGGARLAGSLLGWEFQGPHYLTMLDAAIEWRRATGTSADAIAPYQLRRWEERHGFGTW